jgi:hypothetical protein
MAKVTSLIELRGSIDDLTFRKTEHGIIAGMKPGPSREKVLTHKNFKRTRRNAAEFKLAIQDARLLRHALGAALNGKTGSSLNGRMNGVFCKAARQDRESDRGCRRASKGATGMLQGFDFNKQLSLAHALPVPLLHELDVERGICQVKVPAFMARKRKGFPAIATHFRIVSGVAMVDFVQEHYRQDVQWGALLPLSKQMPADSCFEHRLEPGAGKVMVQVLGMQFYKLVDGKEVLVKGSAVRVLEAVRIADEAMGTSTQPHEAELHTCASEGTTQPTFSEASVSEDGKEVGREREGELPGTRSEELLHELSVREEDGMAEGIEQEKDAIDEIDSCPSEFNKVVLSFIDKHVSMLRGRAMIFPLHW